MLTRRSVMIGTSTVAASVAMTPSRLLAATERIVEDQRGDIDLNWETLDCARAPIAAILSGEMKALFEPKADGFSNALVKTASSFVGMSRSKNSGDVSEFLELYNLPYRWANGTFVPFCAAGLSFAAGIAYAELLGKKYDPSVRSERLSTLKNILPDIEHHWFYPTPSVRDMYYVGEGKRRAVNVSKTEKPVPKPGWIVIYNFGKGYDHCGIVESATKERLITIEFNTADPTSKDERNGGSVQRKTRPYDDKIRAFIKT